VNLSLLLLQHSSGNADSESGLLVLLFLLLLLLLCLLLLEGSENSDSESELLVLLLVFDLTFALPLPPNRAAPRIPTNCFRAQVRMAGGCQPDAEISPAAGSVVIGPSDVASARSAHLSFLYSTGCTSPFVTTAASNLRGNPACITRRLTRLAGSSWFPWAARPMNCTFRYSASRKRTTRCGSSSMAGRSSYTGSMTSDVVSVTIQK
jgi:hypothetical protein